MLQTVRFTHAGDEKIVNYTDTDAVLPVINKQGQSVLVVWGRRKAEPGNLPVGSIIKLSDFDTPKLSPFRYRPVRIAVLGFVMADIGGMPSNHLVTAGHYLHGVLLEKDGELRSYIVMIEPELDSPFRLWPKIIINPD